MPRLLVDTHALLWFVQGDTRMSAVGRSVLDNPANSIFVSAATGWEIATKVRAGRLRIDASSPAAFFADLFAHPRVAALSIEMRHALHVYELPRHHSDPFDRLLIAQAAIERMPLVTGDSLIRRYDVETVW